MELLSKKFDAVGLETHLAYSLRNFGVIGPRFIQRPHIQARSNYLKINIAAQLRGMRFQ